MTIISEFRLAEQLAQEEAERLAAEAPKAMEMRGDKMQNLGYQQKKRREQEEWEKFVNCDCKPNVHFESELSCYLEVLRQETSPESITDALVCCKESEAIAADLEDLYSKSRGNRYGNGKVLLQKIHFRVQKIAKMIFLKQNG